MSTYSYKNPKFINSPKGVVEVVEVIYDGKDDPAYSLAIIKWENTYKLGTSLIVNGTITANRTGKMNV